MSPSKSVIAFLLLALASPAMGQGLYQDIQREFADENQLQRDVRRYQHDVATGHLLRAAADRARINNDESNIRYDQAIVQNDLASQGTGYQAQGLVEHPQYPGYYYYPSQPAQLYYYPNTAQPRAAAASPAFVGPPSPASSGTSAQPTYVGPPSQSAVGGLPGPANVPPANLGQANPVTFNLTPAAKTISVLISNPADTGVPINFAVEGTSYSVPSGYTQKLTATSTSIVEFDRGDAFGDGRYSLIEGAYEFKYTDRGWELFRKQPRPPVPTNGSLPRNAPPRSVASTGPAPGPDVVPPPPTPDATLPR